MYKVILFDLDGTLTESGEGITKSVQYALERIGKPEPDLGKLKVFIGPPLMEMFMQYAQIDEATAKQAVEIYRERYSVTGIFENAVYPGIENMLAQLEKKGYILAVASSKPEVYVRQILDHFGLTRYFTEIGGSELNGRRTNKTEVIEDVLKRLNMDKHRDQVIMVGDKEHDVYGARKAGLECIAVSFGYGTEEVYVSEVPHIHHSSDNDSPEYLRSLSRLQKPVRLPVQFPVLPQCFPAVLLIRYVCLFFSYFFPFLSLSEISFLHFLNTNHFYGLSFG